MHVGLASIFQGTDPKRTDHEVYQRELKLAELGATLGFESIWGVEHHFDAYTMCPDVLQFLSYIAGRCPNVRVGSMVVVLPWHDPMRVAEEIAMLDLMSDGRFILGLGRGLARIEFEGFGIDQNTARERFVESAEMILTGLERGYCEYDGQYIKQVRRDIRPAPKSSFKGRTYAAAVSPESVEIMAKLGVGILIIPQKPWDVVEAELANYRAIFRKVNGFEAPAPIMGGWTFCDKDAGRAEEMARKYIGGYWKTVIAHYEFNADYLTKTKGYESYKAMAERAASADGADEMVEFFLSIQIWGTPEMCYDKIMKCRGHSGAGAFNGVFSYAGMPWDMAEANMRLFAKEVLPELKKVEAKPLIDYAQAAE
ncbi:LLM class flavin-dependent oxidoreductase [Zavarzinia sp. CC-PAN008]|uniref:LLM class flavin-dependent oxidoreductase n=1 Tax=Zavarzinia sp. CC-PAN008 TaxID=3243332 RepID=UPI003F74464E